jgi:hypothetical protein
MSGRWQQTFSILSLRVLNNSWQQRQQSRCYEQEDKLAEMNSILFIIISTHLVRLSVCAGGKIDTLDTWHVSELHAAVLERVTLHNSVQVR